MRTFLPEILAASISGSVMALVLLGIRRIFRKNISRTWCSYTAADSLFAHTGADGAAGSFRKTGRIRVVRSACAGDCCGGYRAGVFWRQYGSNGC